MGAAQQEFGFEDNVELFRTMREALETAHRSPANRAGRTLYGRYKALTRA